MTGSPWVRWLLYGGALAGVLWLAAQPVPAQLLSGYDIFRTQCDGCHELPDPEERVRTRAEWEAILKEMVEVRGASLTKQEFAAVLSFLDSFNQQPRQIQWVQAPAKARSVTFTAQQAGPLPQEWVSLAYRAPSPAPWSIQTDRTGQLAFLAPGRPLKEGEHALLIDNRGVLTNGTLTTRLRLAAGKSPGAGIVFGLRNAQTYFGARVGPPGSRGVILYEVDPEGVAVLGTGPSAARVGDWVTLSVTITGRNVAVSVNGKPALRRAVERYRGGHVGITTHGDTLAWFDRWSVAVR